MTLSDRARDRMTVRQQKMLAETRDCPCSSCSGVLDRFEIYEEDRMIIERYRHKAGNADCPGNDPNNGFWTPAGNYVTHYLDRSEGGGVLEGEFR